MAALPPPDRILVARGPGETRFALMRGDDLVEIIHHRDGALLSGAVYFARIGTPVPHMPAVFVTLGAATGLLKMKPPFPTQGAGVSVAVIVPGRADKNAEVALTADVPVPADGKPGALLRAAPDPASAWEERYGLSMIRGTPAGPGDLFADVDAAIAAALEPMTPLPSGGSLIIERTAAAICIDVNAGPAAPDTANREALEVSARELRRRNLAGHILIDVIPTKRRGALPRLLTGFVADDPAGVRVAGATPLGMIELTRRRVGLSLMEQLCDDNGRVSAETTALQVLRDAVRFAFTAKAAHVAVAVAPEVDAALARLTSAKAEAEDMMKGEIRIAARADFARSRFDLQPA